MLGAFELTHIIRHVNTRFLRPEGDIALKVGDVFKKPKKVLLYDPQKHHLKAFCSHL